ncbi:RAQPRD family integrative conjugative element protein [Pseudomonas corrugata]|uniref:integrative conjugative element protein, RAQPRD family n=1 Tax=Pseudomonas corrugata TaxID=47879 RepID=UPI002230BAAE|nr:RAQPRD family integrative conjugative element protein [Pseudomonas corrugata]UZD97662.1 RAQPRD family integrative conjugative element protein [Pseudomonas corrugata]
MPTPLFRSLLLVVLTIIHGAGYTASAHEEDQFSLIQQQLDIIELLATQAETASTAKPNKRYRFDYLRLTQDIRRIRQGVQNYLSPSRAQPQDPGELIGDYQLDTLLTEPTP